MKKVSLGLILGLMLISTTYGATITSTQSGDWSDISTWGGSLPGVGDQVRILAGHTVIYETDTEVDRISISGKLEFSRSVSTNLEVNGNIIVEGSGTLEIGTIDNPIPGSVTHTIVIDSWPNANFIGGFNFEEVDTGLWNFGTWESHGQPVEHTWTKLAQTANAGSNVVIAEGDLTDWPVGSSVLLTTTDIGSDSGSYNDNDFSTQDEVRTISSVTDLGGGLTEITLDSSLTHEHYAEGDTKGEIALLSRNIVITSKTNERSHTVFMGGSTGGLSYTEFRKLGPNNILSRYPVHLHKMDAGAIGFIIRGNSIWDSENRFLSLHNALGVHVEENVGYRALREAFWLEWDKVGPMPRHNVFIRNLAVKVNSLDRFERRMAAFTADRDNVHIDNVAVSVKDNTETSGFVWHENAHQDSTQVFISNEAHSNKFGLFGWQNSGHYHIVDFLSWRNHEGVKWGAYSNDVQFHKLTSVENEEKNFRTRNNHPHIQDSKLYGTSNVATPDGFWVDDYTLIPNPDDPARIIRSLFYGHSESDFDHKVKTSCGLPMSGCVPSYYAIIDTVFQSAQNIRFDTDWQTTDTFLDIQGWLGTDGPSLPENFRITRIDQPQPTGSQAESSYGADFDGAWIDPTHPTPGTYDEPPTIEWINPPALLGNSPVTFTAKGEGFTTDVGDVEIWIDDKLFGEPWVAEYYDNIEPTGTPVAILNEHDIDYNGGTIKLQSDPNIWIGRSYLDAPFTYYDPPLGETVELLTRTKWSARFTRSFTTTGGEYEFDYDIEDGFRFFIDGSVIENQWAASNGRTGTFRHTFSPGTYDLVLEYTQRDSSSNTRIRFDFYRVHNSNEYTESFTFDPTTWDRKYAYVYARAHDPATNLFAYSDVLKLRNPNWIAAASEPPVIVTTTTTSTTTTTIPTTTTTLPSGSCTQILGFSQTRGWFEEGDIFESIVDDNQWQLQWRSGGGLNFWSNPDSNAWTQPIVSQCTQNSNSPDRVLLTISGTAGTNVDSWESLIEQTVTNIRDKIPSAQEILLQPVVGGPGEALCPDSSSGFIRASEQHPAIDQAIARVAANHNDVTIGFSPEVRDCSDYNDDIGHLINSASEAAGQTIGSYYAGIPLPTTTTTLPSIPTTGRVTENLVALYDFKENSGTTVNDISGVGSPMDLEIQDTSEITVLQNGGVDIQGSSIKSTGPATKIIDAVKSSGEVTLEAWITPNSLTQTGPARIATISGGTALSDINVHLGQQNDAVSYRLRTSGSTNANNFNGPTTFQNTIDPIHVAVTYNGNSMKIFINGMPSTQSETGDLSNWDDSYELILGNEATDDRPWLGKIFLLAVYDKELTQAEIDQNFNNGFDLSTTTTTSTTTTQPGQTTTSSTSSSTTTTVIGQTTTTVATTTTQSASSGGGSSSESSSVRKITTIENEVTGKNDIIEVTSKDDRIPVIGDIDIEMITSKIIENGEEFEVTLKLKSDQVASGILISLAGEFNTLEYVYEDIREDDNFNLLTENSGQFIYDEKILNFEAGEEKELKLKVKAPKRLKGEFTLAASAVGGSYEFSEVTDVVKIDFKPTVLDVLESKTEDNRTFVNISTINFEENITTEIEIILDNSSTVFLDIIKGKIDYNSQLELITDGDYTIKTTTKAPDGSILDEDIRILSVTGQQGSDFIFVIIGVLIILLAAPIIKFIMIKS